MSAERRLAVTLWCAGVAAFAAMYAPQGLLPQIAADVAAAPSQAALLISVTTLGLAERLVIAMQNDEGAALDRALLDEQASVVLTYLGGLVFAFANDSSESLSRDDIARQIRAVVLGVAAERAESR
ncbi:hypothetical protein ACTWP6_24485 [Mycobacterium sp. 4D054]|uniref:hypothetical protein n=1 Tax=Mycobacterium sp. 4D054 TaxID=3457440 RepID=UPI003FCF9D90